MRPALQRACCALPSLTSDSNREGWLAAHPPPPHSHPHPRTPHPPTHPASAVQVEEAYIACGESQRDEYLYCLLAKHPGEGVATPTPLTHPMLCTRQTPYSARPASPHPPMPSTCCLASPAACLCRPTAGRTIVFVNAISSVRRLAAILKLLGLPAQALHAGGWVGQLQPAEAQAVCRPAMPAFQQHQ